mgnify:FL=1|jgi:hypothetical protein|tara:strand:+ start:452 stop:871 length:420 start_codon:yes stop_codon:yes gene_type:complete
MKKCYIAGPYSSPAECIAYDNIQNARKTAMNFWSFGFSVFCPHLNTAHMGDWISHDRFVEGDLEWLKHSDLVILLPRWHKSSGSRSEERMAELCQIPTFLSHNDADNRYTTHYMPPQYEHIYSNVMTNLTFTELASRDD